MSGKRVAALVLALGLLPACGSTVQQQGRLLGGVGAPSADGLTVPATGGVPATADGLASNGSPVTGPGAALSGGAAPGAVANPTSADDAGGVAPSGTTTFRGPAVAGGTPAPGGPIKVGFVNTKVGNAESFGINAGQTYSTDRIFRGLVTAMNARGGLKGRRILPVTADTDTASNDWSRDFQAACERLTRDEKVAAVVGYVFAHIDAFEACLAKAGVPHLSGAYTVGDEQTLRSFPGLVGTSALSADRRYRLQLEAPLREGYLTKQSKIGLLLDACAEQARAVKRTVEPFMKQAGLTEAARVTMSCPAGAGDVGPAAAQVQSAVLRFRENGVDRVFIEGVPLVVFAQAAESQAYRPGYIVTSTAGGAAVQANIPPAQAANVHGYGWMPSIDVDLRNQPPRTSSQKRCMGLLETQGIKPAQYNDYLAAFTTCDGLFLYEALLTRTNGDTAAPNIARAVGGLGTSYAGVNVYGGRTALSAGDRDAPTQYRPWAWGSSCSCFRYTGAERPIS